MPEQPGQGTLSVTDNRTGRTYEIPVEDGAVRATALRQIKTADDDAGLVSYDPAFLNTASCRSAITFIDGERGILRYRGYPIQELAERRTFLEVAYLLLEGELPDEAQLAAWRQEVTWHTLLHENVKKFIDGFHHDAHPMGILVSTVGALSTFYPDAKKIHDAAKRHEQIVRLIAKIPTLAAFAYRHAVGLPYAYPNNELSYAGNFLNMMWKAVELEYQPDPILEHALDVLLILHADHEQNCSTNAMRAVGSAHADPYSAAAAAAAALYGPLHGGANEQVLRMLDEIGSVDRPPSADHQAGGRGGVQGHRPEPSPGDRGRARAGRARGRLLRAPPALPERGLLLGHHLPGDGLPGRDVPGAVRDRPHAGLARPVAGGAARPRAEDRPAPAALRRGGRTPRPGGAGGRAGLSRGGRRPRRVGRQRAAWKPARVATAQAPIASTA